MTKWFAGGVPLLLVVLILLLSGHSHSEEKAGREHVRDERVHARGAWVYRRACSGCHQNRGQGLRVVFPPLAGSEWIEGDPSLAIKIILKGMTGKIEVAGKNYIGAMLPLEGQLSDQHIAEVLTFVRQSWGNDDAPVSAGVVAKVREEVKGQTEMWEAEKMAKP